jgi:FtsZ-interacting cell division protein ZipA
MPELRWALLGLGAAFIVGLVLWEWRRGRRRLAQSSAESAVPAAGGEDWSRRVEPRLDSLLESHGPVSAHHPAIHDVPVIHPTEPPAQVVVPVAREVAVDTPVAAMMPTAAAKPENPSIAAKPATREIRWPPERADRVLTLRLVSTQGALLAGREVRLALEQAGMVHGPQNIYHLVDAQGAVLVSAANMLRPGDLDPAKVDEEQLRGLSLFTILPGALAPVRMLEELVAIGRAVAWRLGATVQDEHGAEVDGDVLVKLRQSLPDAAEQEST